MQPRRKRPLLHGATCVNVGTRSLVFRDDAKVLVNRSIWNSESPFGYEMEARLVGTILVCEIDSLLTKSLSAPAYDVEKHVEIEKIYK